MTSHIPYYSTIALPGIIKINFSIFEPKEKENDIYTIVLLVIVTIEIVVIIIIIIIIEIIT